MSNRFRGTLYFAVLAVAMSGAASGAATHQKKHPQATSTGYAKQCAALWPRYLQADLKMGVEEFDETRSPAEIEDLHRKYTAMCLSQGPDAPDIKWLLAHY